MSIGLSVFLIAVGAIIAFALKVETSWLDLRVVGWILMVAGVIGVVLTLVMWQRRRTVRVVEDGRERTIDEVESPSADSL
jgi:uncharacterized membrane protein